MFQNDGVITRSRVHSQPGGLNSPFGNFSSVKPENSKQGKVSISVANPKTDKKEKKKFVSSNLNEDMAGSEPTNQHDLSRIHELEPNEVSPEQWLEMFKSLNATLTTLRNDISELKTGKLDHFSKD